MMSAIFESVSDVMKEGMWQITVQSILLYKGDFHVQVGGLSSREVLMRRHNIFDRLTR